MGERRRRVVGSTVFTVCATLAWTPTKPKGDTVNHELILTIDMEAEVFQGFQSADDDACTDSAYEMGRMLRDLAEMIETGGMLDEPIGLLDHNGHTIAVLRERAPITKPQASCVTHGSVMPCDCFQAAPAKLAPKAIDYDDNNGPWWVSALVNSIV